MAWSPPDEIGESHPRISEAKDYLERRFSYAQIIGDDRTDLITPEFLEAQQIFKNRVHADVLRGRREGPDLDPNSTAFDWATQTQMGLIPRTTPAPEIEPYYGLSWTGTWGAWDNGYGWQVLRRARERAPKKIAIQGLGYDTNAFMIGNNPQHSYLDMIEDGVAEGRRFAIPDRRKKVLTGYSGGAGAVVEFLHRWPADRRDEIAMVLQFGDPNRPPGRTLLGNDPGGHGISEDFPPDWVLNRYYSFTLPGDMYPNATGLLPFFYDILTRMEATPEFAMYLFNLFVGQLGTLTQFGAAALGVAGNVAIPGFGALAGLLPLITGSVIGSDQAVPNLLLMLTNIPAIVASLMKLLKFVTTSDHTNYHLTPAFDGMSAEDKAIELILSLP